MSEKSWEEMNENERERACNYSSCPVCPYCGHIHDMDTYEDFEPGREGVEECHNCDKKFSWSSDIEVYYSTEKIEKEAGK